MLKRFLSFILALMIVSAPLFGGVGTVSAASADDLEATIEKQIRAFADSIDKSNADDAAAAAFAGHGIRGGGKTLKVGKSHALTATLFNSEMMQVGLTDVICAAIQAMQKLDNTLMEHNYGIFKWSKNKGSYQCYVYTGERKAVEDRTNRDWTLAHVDPYTGTLNGYDNSLEWMVSGATVHIQLERTKTTAAEQTYKVTCKVIDRFDFSTSGSSGFKNLISGIGALLFKEFDWESSVTFNLTVPYSCSHSSGMYRWTYDTEKHTFTSDGSGNYIENKTTRHALESSDASSYYYELDQTVRLYHDAPWVLEYDVKNLIDLALSPLRASNSATNPSLLNTGRSYLWILNREYMTVSDSIVKEYGLSSPNQYTINYYGTALSTLFGYNKKNIYTLRLENEVNADDSNMIYLTVHNADTGELLLEKVPMDDYYQMQSWTWETTHISSQNDWLSGKDLFISYIGNTDYCFSADHFELRIWENGIDGGSGTYYNGKVTKPTCTKQGYTTYTCSCCGYSYKDDKVKATGHSFGDWTTVTAATCTKAGEEQRSCKNCDHSETREIAATGHNYENYICTGCGDTLYIPGDVDTNGTVDVDDVLALLWNVLFPEEYPIEVPADFDGNGITDVDDVLKLLWYVLFPEDYPLN